MKLNVVAASLLNDRYRVEYHKKYIDSCLYQKNFDKINFTIFYEPNIYDASILNNLYCYTNFNIKINPYQFGANFNHYNCLYYCFEYLKLDHVLMTENDVELSNDIYEIVNFYLNSEYYDKENIFSLLNKDNLLGDFVYIESESNIVQIKSFQNRNLDYFNACAWLVTRKIWNDTLKYWNKVKSYDFEIFDKYHKNYKIIVPKHSRVMHLGKYGVNYNEEFFNAHGWNNYSVKKYKNNLNYKFEFNHQY